MSTGLAKWLLVMLMLNGICLTSVNTGLGSLYERPKERAPLPGPLGYVSDHAGVLDDEWKERIRSVCQDLERKTGVEMVVVTVPSIKPFG